MPGSVVLDNAFLYGVASFFKRHNNNQYVRNVNILSLSALVDAIIMHQRLIVIQKGGIIFKKRSHDFGFREYSRMLISLTLN